jgi:transcriptional regulator GlxA family with amidase domain
VPLFQGFQLLDVVGPMDVFHAANAITGEMFYELCLAAPSAGPVTCSNGAAVEVSTELSDVQSPFDVIIVPGGAPFMEEYAAPGIGLHRRVHSGVDRAGG